VVTVTGGPSFFTESDTADGVCTIRVFGDLDLASADSLTAAAREAEASSVEAVVLDLSGVEFLDSTGVRAVVHSVRFSRAATNKLRVRREYNRQVARVLELTGVVGWLPFV
jgi:anti-sigma B factor antagonist